MLMHQTRLQVQNSKLLREIHEYSKELQKYGTIGGLISTGAFFCTKTFYILSSPTVTYWILKYPDLMRAIWIMSPVYTFSLVMMLLLKLALQEFYFSGNNRAIPVRVLKILSTLFLFPFELSIYGVKSIIVITFSFRSECRDLFRQSDGSIGAFYILMYIAVYSDFLITVIICYMKSTVLRPLLPNGGFFSKVDGSFEYFFILLIPLKHLFFFLSNSNDLITIDGITPASSVNWAYYAIELVLMVCITSIYLKELPYYHPTSERVLAHFLFTTFWIFLFKGATRGDIDMTFKLLLFVLPLQLVSLEYFLAYVYRIDYMDTKQMKEAKCLKQVTVNEREKEAANIFELVYSQGVFINYIKKKKNINSSEQAMWLNVQKFKGENNAQDSQEGNGEDEDGLLSHHKSSRNAHFEQNDIPADEFTHEGRITNSDPSKDDISKTKTKIEHIIVNAYVDNNKKFPFAHLVRLYWTLNNRLVIYNIFQDLKDLLELAVSFKSRFMYFYALKEVEDYLQSLYQNPEVINLESAGDIFTTSLVGGKIAKDLGMLDLTYALFQKYTVKYVKSMIDSYAEKNSKFIEDLSLGSTTFKVMHIKVRELFQFNHKISKCFDSYHANSKNTENVHILPYCVHLCYNVNCLRTGKAYLSEYIKRSQIIKRIHDERNPMIIPDNLLIDSAIFLVDSQPGVIGNIVDVYGETEKLLCVSAKSLIGKSPNYLIPATMAQYHDKIMQCYMSKPLRYFMGIQRDSFIRIPESKFIISSHIVFKLAPNIESGFKIVVASRPNQKKYNQKMIINHDFLIDSYSYNFLSLLHDNCLAVNVPVSNLSKDLFTFIQKQIRALEGANGDVLRSKHKRAIVNKFNKHISKEMALANKYRRRQRRDQEDDVDDSFDNMLKKHADNDERLFSSNIFELNFVNSETQKVICKYFEVTLEVKEFPDVDKRLYYLDMTIVDESDFKLSSFKKNDTGKSSKASLGHPFQTEASVINPKQHNMDTQSFAKDTIIKDLRSKSSMKVEDKKQLNHPNKNLQIKILRLPDATPPRLDSLNSIKDEADFDENMIDEFGVKSKLDIPARDDAGSINDDIASNGHSYKFLKKDSKPVISHMPLMKTKPSRMIVNEPQTPQAIALDSLGML